MDFMLIDAVYSKDFKLDEETLKRCSQHKVIALYAAVQFSSKLDNVIRQLGQSGVKVITSQPARTDSQYQILGCDNYEDSLGLPEEPDIFLYVGDGQFHPRALLLSQKDQPRLKEVICYDPIEDRHTVLDEQNILRILKKYKASLIKFLSSDVIGVVATTKPGQEQLDQGLLLPKKFADKQVYFFVDNNINPADFENFPFIQIWVNTACPRIGFDDAANMEGSMININDALHAEDILGKASILNQ